MNNRYKFVWFVIGSIIFLCIPVFSSPDFGQGQNLFRIPMFLSMFTAYVGVLLFFYVNFFYLIPRLYFRKKYIPFIAAVVLIYCIVEYVPDAIFGSRRPSPVSEETRQHLPRNDKPQREISFHTGKPRRSPPVLPQNVFFQFSIVAFISLLLRINRRLEETESEKLKSEIAYLRAQINPHFLFNTLNSLYALTLEKSDDAPDAVFRLSRMMRYTLNESSKDKVALKQELEYIQHFIELQKLRLTSQTTLEYDIPDDDNNLLQIAPLLLICFIENAFKYGVHPDIASYIGIFVKIAGHRLELTVSNNIVSEHGEEGKSGIGISNTRNRLELLYPERHKLSIAENENHYKVNLIINLDAESDSHR